MPKATKTPPPEAAKTPPAPVKKSPEPSFGTTPAPHPSEYFLPPDRLAEVEKKFEECGAVEIVIKRTLGQCQVVVTQLSAPIVPANAPEPVSAPLEPIFPKSAPTVNVASPLAAPAEAPNPGIFFGMPTLQRGLASRLRAMMGNYKHMLGPIGIIPGHDVDVARNIIATEFLGTGAPWLFMMDDDVIPPFGNAVMFNRITGAGYAPEFMEQRAAESLTTCGEKFVGAVYVTRSGERRPVTKAGMKSESMNDDNLVKRIRSGPKRELVKVPWVGLGCVAIHRCVFEAIMDRHPELKDQASGNWKFFTYTDNKAEDIQFSQLATECGFPPFLNLAVVCGHIGEVAYMP